MENEKGLLVSSLDEVLKNSMIPYAENVILDRALPRVEDGLKPVQRRILYAMYEMGLTHDKPHRKCAKIVGDVLGKYHPHGDSSVYDALVRLAQDFNMRMPLVNGHGNFGTVDGDGAAAYRYTEARLEPLALELLKDIDKNTVNFNLNFDDTTEEPETLPGRYPNLLVNGTTGIAVGLATNIPPHNLVEVIDGTIAYIDNPKISLKDMMKYIPAPDFPTGGYIIANDELEEAYKTGRGKIKIRARVTVEKEGEKQSLIISELPYQVNKANLLKKIADMREERKDVLGGIKDVVDESDRNGMRAVIRLAKDVDPKKILAYLYKNTDLETSFGINMVAIAHGKPCQLGLLDIIGYYVNYQRDVILRRSKFELERAKERAHILEGLIVAVKNIDEVVQIIKKADNTADARAKLRARFNLSEAQANAILDLRLARLTKLEVTKLEEELAALKKRIAELESIISSKARQMTVVKSELNAIKKKYGEIRRSSIMTGSGEQVASVDVEKELKKIDNFVVAYTAGGAFKKMTERNFTSSDKAIKDNTSADDAITAICKISSDKTLYAFTNLGNCCKIDVEIAPECRYREKGVKFNAVCRDAARNERPVAFFEVDESKMPDGHLIFVTKDGLIKKTEWSEYTVIKPYYQAIKLKDGDELIAVWQDEPETTIAFVTEQGNVLNALKDDIPVQGRVAGGVKGINLNKGDKIVFVSQVEDVGEFLIVTDAGFYKRVITCQIEPMPRYRKGVMIASLGKGDKVIYASYVKEAFDFAVVDNFGVAFGVNTEDVSIEPRTTKGKTLKNENKKRKPEKAFRIY